jgi:RHH-type transcriptional regulator, proline utilization regulon repressor / proline dehydrogenase / delta 1-pyrroline-5-carboxylate dehydrogenase
LLAAGFLTMLFGAMDELSLGDPWLNETDIGPLISTQAQHDIQKYIESARSEGRLLKQLKAPNLGSFVGPAVIEVNGIQDLEHEIFGPVLHIARYRAEDYEATIDAVNATGYGLTFGLHTRIDERVKNISAQLRAGNIYVNRNQVGAVVESQPFGGEGLSGTGPKAGGPRYVQRFTQPYRSISQVEDANQPSMTLVQQAIDDVYRPEPELLAIDEMTGPTGESNRLGIWPRGVILCLGPTLDDALGQAGTARRCGCPAVIIAPGASGPGCLDGLLNRAHLGELKGFEVVALASDDADLRLARLALANRPGKLIPLCASENLDQYCVVERHTCIDTTAAGGNASLLTQIDEDDDGDAD